MIKLDTYFRYTITVFHVSGVEIKKDICSEFQCNFIPLCAVICCVRILPNQY